MLWLLMFLIWATVVAWNLGGREVLRERRYRATAKALGMQTRAKIMLHYWLH